MRLLYCVKYNWAVVKLKVAVEAGFGGEFGWRIPDLLHLFAGILGLVEGLRSEVKYAELTVGTPTM